MTVRRDSWSSKKARVRWFLSINEAHLPDEIKMKKTAYIQSNANK